MRGQSPGALGRHQGCRRGVRGARGAREPQGGYGGLTAASSLIDPILSTPLLKKMVLECVSTADMGGACRRRVAPLPCVRRASVRPARRLRSCGCARRVGSRSRSARSAWCGLLEDQGAGRLSRGDAGRRGGERSGGSVAPVNREGVNPSPTYARRPSGLQTDVGAGPRAIVGGGDPSDQPV